MAAEIRNPTLPLLPTLNHDMHGLEIFLSTFQPLSTRLCCCFSAQGSSDFDPGVLLSVTSACPALRSLRIDSMHARIEGVAALTRLTRLRNLHLSTSPFPTDLTGCQDFWSGPSDTRYSRPRDTHLSSEEAAHLGSLTGLTSLGAFVLDPSALLPHLLPRCVEGRMEGLVNLTSLHIVTVTCAAAVPEAGDGQELAPPQIMMGLGELRALRSLTRKLAVVLPSVLPSPSLALHEHSLSQRLYSLHHAGCVFVFLLTPLSMPDPNHAGWSPLRTGAAPSASCPPSWSRLSPHARAWNVWSSGAAISRGTRMAQWRATSLMLLLQSLAFLPCHT